MLNKILVKLSLAVVITALNTSLAFCQVGVVDVVHRQASFEVSEVSVSLTISGETKITIVQNGQTILETVASEFATIPLYLGPGVYQIVATHSPTEQREIHWFQLEE